MNYFRNHQLYLAEKCDWLDRQVNKTSLRCLMKVASYKECKEPKQKYLILKLVKDSMFNTISNREIFRREGFYVQNMNN